MKTTRRTRSRRVSALLDEINALQADVARLPDGSTENEKLEVQVRAAELHAALENWYLALLGIPADERQIYRCPNGYVYKRFNA
jgi:hypothetical protein